MPVIRPQVTETTAQGAAYAAGLAVGFWSGFGELKENWAVDKTWQPQMEQGARKKQYRGWKKAVERTFGWLGRFRRLARDYERLASTLEGWHWLAFIVLALAKIGINSA